MTRAGAAPPPTEQLQSEAPFADLRTSYSLGEPIEVGELPAGTSAVVVETAFGSRFVADRAEGGARFAELPAGTHAVVALAGDGSVLVEDFTSLRRVRGEDPVLGFASSFQVDRVGPVLAWLRRLRCTAVQVYDWMERYSAPLPRAARYHDPLGRALDRPALERLLAGVRDLGAVAQAYAPVYAADAGFATTHPGMRLYRGDGEPQRLGDLLQIMNPAHPGWQGHWLEAYGGAADTLGFAGFHLDTYGYPREALDSEGRPVALTQAYRCFVEAVRRERPSDLLSFNQVNGVPAGFAPPPAPSFRYIEAWPPNDLWRHLEGLLARSTDGARRHGETLAIYPPVWNAPRAEALRTAVLTEAVATALGANVLLYGDEYGVLDRPYYVDHEQLESAEVDVVLAWRRFALRCRDLFRGGLDASWTELGDENGAVHVAWEGGPVSPEPRGGALFARVVHHERHVAVSLLDLSGSSDGSWRSPTAAGRCRVVTVSLLVTEPERIHASAAVLGRNRDRFSPLATTPTGHREGFAISCRVPIESGWSVLRVDRDGRTGS